MSSKVFVSIKKPTKVISHNVIFRIFAPAFGTGKIRI